MRQALLAASPATLDRLLALARAQHGRPRGGTRPGTLLRQQIPLRGGLWDENQAGYLEMEQPVQLAYMDQGYTGQEPSEAAAQAGLRLEVVKHHGPNGALSFYPDAGGGGAVFRLGRLLPSPGSGL